MKTRASFITNSSSSSYVCTICNTAEEVENDNFRWSGFNVCMGCGEISCSSHNTNLSYDKDMLHVNMFMDLFNDKEFVEMIINDSNANPRNYKWGGSYRVKNLLQGKPEWKKVSVLLEMAPYDFNHGFDKAITELINGKEAGDVIYLVETQILDYIVPSCPICRMEYISTKHIRSYVEKERWELIAAFSDDCANLQFKLEKEKGECLVMYDEGNNYNWFHGSKIVTLTDAKRFIKEIAKNRK